MNTLKTFALAPVLALAALTPFAAAQAEEKHDDIVVTSPSAMADWQASTTRSLDRALQRSPLERTTTPDSGIVQVTFTLGADGRPQDVAIYDSSANWAAERSALYAVRRLGDIGDVPVTNPQGVQFLANIIFADSAIERDDLARTLAASETARLASGEPASAFIALGS